MATRAATVELLGSTAVRVTWAGLLNGDDGEAITWPLYSDRSVQVLGTFGAGGSVSVEGSNDGVNFVSMSDPRGNNLAITSARIEQVEDLSHSLRPRVTAGDGTTNLTVIMFARRG